ncbi:glutathione S-transferase family protein [Paraburkholderia hospita]|jgi:GST-like protein|uniref:Glutathione S-transferase n=1 Tax=Paraburkholderia hospita TaxID=169430 RepID=A0AAN1JIP1_9BURK|nr:glutathione binding-like protein [Paraburkholderia hospita]AUT74735.1 glutathione S-transferase [Paraburkholderia hospita]EIN02668.1 glutathione S-transferase [Paraburkholderia hospita]OUL82149.1 glutathione S-transferase [Paraburkholderia hospita]OUL96170.1 glutathione S-transferase [Paraburkholderia hospita]OUL96983.1 glutathione S-transferase [Paraburkholderia hospita]
MLQFYFHPTPNPFKVALLLEELETPFELSPVDTFKGEQHAPAYRKINPNGKVPAIVDDGVTVFDSHAILLHLGAKHGKFVPSAASERAAMLSWLQFVATGLSPFSGQAVHFLHHAPEPLPYARNRYLKEVERHYRVLDERLETSKYLAGDTYSIADIALWGWANFAGYIFGEKGLSDYPHVKRLVDEISARPAAVRALALKDRLTFKAEFDEETRRALFPQNASLTV